MAGAVSDVSSEYLQADYANLAVRAAARRHGVSCLLLWLTMLGVVQRLVAALEAADAELENSHSKRVVKFIR